VEAYPPQAYLAEHPCACACRDASYVGVGAYHPVDRNREQVGTLGVGILALQAASYQEGQPQVEACRETGI
jgi:hypothetical protein